MAPSNEPTRAEIRKKVLELLSKGQNCLSVDTVWETFGCRPVHPKDEATPADSFAEYVVDVFRELHLKGVLTYEVDWDRSRTAPALLKANEAKLTESGAKARDEGTFDSIEWLSAEDYVNAVEETAGGKLDCVIRTYLREAKRAFDEHLWLSCAVTLGCASEKAILLLGEAAKAYFQDPKLTNVIDDEKGLINHKFTEVMERLDDKGNKRAIRQKAAGIGADASPLGELSVVECLFQLYRIHRNDAGHPTGRQPDRDVLLCYLQGVKAYARIVTGLTSLLRQLSSGTP